MNHAKDCATPNSALCWFGPDFKLANQALENQVIAQLWLVLDEFGCALTREIADALVTSPAPLQQLASLVAAIELSRTQLRSG